MKVQRRRRRRRLLTAAVAAGALAVLSAFALIHVMASASAGQRGKAALTRAEGSLSARDLSRARADLAEAHAAFVQTREELSALGPVATVARRVPLLGDQLRAVDAFAEAGLTLSRAGQPLVNAADTILSPENEHLPISEAMDALRSTQQSLGPAVAAINHAVDQVAPLKHQFLMGPLGRARDDLLDRLPRIRARATSAEQGLTALMAFAGGSGPKRYLFLSQNPDEVRPTGGFIGTYGVLTAEAGHLTLERYRNITEWISRRDAAVPPELAGSPFRHHSPPLPRTMANVNSIPDWPQAARLAAELWQKGGEEPVDGVVSFTPGFMARILSVVGPITLPAYNETVTAENLHDRLDYQTHQSTPLAGVDPKDFVARVAELVMQKLLDAPASQWEPLGQVMGQAFDSREALAWSKDPQVASTLAQRRWDGAFPAVKGDFFYNSEFAYVSKNGRGIQRTYDHTVTLGADGNGRVTTTLTVTNTQPAGTLNTSTLAYLTLYGPESGVFNSGASDGLSISEPALAGHPAVGWFRAAAPGGGQTTVKVTWDVSGLARKIGERAWEYSLLWRHLPDHKGDLVNLSIELPAGWTWKGTRPPTQFSLDQDFQGAWRLSPGD